MGGFFILILLIFAIHYWYVVAAAIALGVACLTGLDAWDDRRAKQAVEARERLRHERARREIDRIALAATQAMCEAARSDSEVIEGTAVEIERP